MSRRLLPLARVAAFALLCAAGSAHAQDIAETPRAASAAQDQEADWTVVEYPEGREVVVVLKPTTLLPEARGTAKVTRSGDGATITLDVSGLEGGGVSSYHFYAVSHEGHVVALGAVPTGGGAGAFSTTTNLSRFMLVVSPQAGLTVVDAATPVALRSTVPEGLAVVPRAGGAAAEEAVSNADTGTEESASSTTLDGAAGADDEPEYDAPLLGISSFRRGSETQLKSLLAGGLAGTRTGVYVKPLKGGETQVKVRFQDLKLPENGARYVLWAVGPDKTYTRLGQVDRLDRRQAARIEARTMLRDFGLFITAESDVATQNPSGPVAALVVR